MGPMRTAAPLSLLLLLACDTVQVDQRRVVERVEAPSRYVVEQDAETPPGATEVEVVAQCDEGDRLVVGGCAWGEIVDAHDQPLRPLADEPAADANGWICRGQNTGVGAELKTLRAVAVCERF